MCTGQQVIFNGFWRKEWKRGRRRGHILNVTVATGHEVNVVIVNLNLSFCHKAKKPFSPTAMNI